MDFLSSLAKGAQTKPASDQPNNTDQQEKLSTSDLFASAKVVADAAQSQFRNEPEKYDKTKVADATADLLSAAKEYGKLDDTKGIGKYVDQAEDYLRQYNSTSQPIATAPAADSGEHKTTDAPAPAPATETGSTEAEKPSGGGGSGAGDYIKMAEGFLNKPSGGAEGGGAGDYVKMAEGFLNKPSGDSEEKTEPPPQSSEGGYGDLMKIAGGFLKK